MVAHARVRLCWTLLYAYLLCDDAFQIHERGGGAIARYRNYEGAFRLTAQDFGELTVFGVFGLFFPGVDFDNVPTQHARREKRIKGSDSLVRANSVFLE